MSIHIDGTVCVGCGACVESCPGNLIKRGADKRAFIRHEKDCWGCTSCVKACPVQAIAFFLGADMGGTGATMTVRKNGSVSTWRVALPDGSTREIAVDASCANKY